MKKLCILLTLLMPTLVLSTSDETFYLRILETPNNPSNVIVQITVETQALGQDDWTAIETDKDIREMTKDIYELPKGTRVKLTAGTSIQTDEGIFGCEVRTKTPFEMNSHKLVVLTSEETDSEPGDITETCAKSIFNIVDALYLTRDESEQLNRDETMEHCDKDEGEMK